MQINYTLVSEGTSDSTLLPILDWVLREHLAREHVVSGSWVDKQRIPRWSSRSAGERLQLAIEVYPCQILFIHRDADSDGLEARLNEIELSASEVALPVDVSRVAVIPIRMTEAWLLVDERAIRRAASNERGSIELSLPPLRRLEGVPDPKAILFDALRQATQLPRRRLKKFNVFTARRRVPEFIENFAVLRDLRAFQAVERQVSQVCTARQWK